jgi:hypothetical protein
MIILWIRKKKAAEQKEIKQNVDSFSEHDDIMKRFRMAHPDINLTAGRDIMTDEGNLLAPVHQVKLAANIQN